MARWVLADDIGIETLGGVFTPMLKAGAALPVEASEVFSTAEDGQSAVSVHLYQGDDPQAQRNRPLGRFDLVGIPPSPKGTPQILVRFAIDADGVLTVSAHDQATRAREELKVAASAAQSVKLRDADAVVSEFKDTGPRLRARVGLEVLGGELHTLIPAGAPLPYSAVMDFGTAQADQTAVDCRLYQGEKALAKDNHLLGTFTFQNVAEGKVANARVPITFTVGEDGSVEVSANDVSGKRIAFTAAQQASVVGGAKNDLISEIVDSLSRSSLDSFFRASVKNQADAGAGQSFKVFVSHASTDAGRALEAVGEIEAARDVRCWIAPRDVRAGYDYRSEIITGIKESTHCVVLMSEAANASPHVLREVSLADQYSKRIILIRLDDSALRPELEYLLAGRHWVSWEAVKGGLAKLL